MPTPRGQGLVLAAATFTSAAMLWGLYFSVMVHAQDRIGAADRDGI